jgi:murein DD-endopeptidase MepM/ murein hydrolase activator NlpD
MKKAITKIIILFAGLLILLSILNISSGPGQLQGQSLEEELQRIKEEREEAQKKIDEVKKTERHYMGEVSQVEEQLIGALSELDGFNARLADAKSIVDRTTIELVLKEEELNKIEDELSEKILILNNRIAEIYKKGNNNVLGILLKAENFIEFISRMKLMNLFAQQDTDNVLDIKDKRNATLGIKKSIIDLREQQKEHREKIERLVVQSEAKTAEVEDLYGEKKNLLYQTRANKNALMAMEKELEIREAEVTRILESYKYGTAPSGKFMWPVAGRLRSGFGWRIHPIFGTNRFHTGIDLTAPHGTLIKAGDGGQVIQAGYSGGYGYTILLYHGGGFASRYAHLSSIRCTVGQFVARGQVIGLVGSTGWTTGPHLHFEIRINGAAQNPLQYLE